MVFIKSFTIQNWGCEDHQTCWLDSISEGDVQQTRADETYACHRLPCQAYH